MSVIGTCQLCLQPNKELKWSHIVSSWLYKRLRELGSSIDSDLVEVSDEVAMISSRQVRTHLLCEGCEQLIGVDEKYVSGIGLQPDGSFPLRDRSSLARVDQGYRVLDLSQFDLPKLRRFACSVFWRADVAQIDPIVDLCGDREGLRLMLLNGSPMPSTVGLLARIVLPDPEGMPTDRYFSFPQTQKNSDLHVFVAVGIRFDLYGNNSMPARLLPLSLSPSGMGVGDNGCRIREMLQKKASNSQPAGKLAREQPTG